MANLTNSAFTLLLTQAAKAANKHMRLKSDVSDECIARYGTSYSDVDADSIIDVLDYIGSDSYTEKEFDEAMILSDCERLDLIAEKIKKLPELDEKQQELLNEIEHKINTTV